MNDRKGSDLHQPGQLMALLEAPKSRVIAVVWSGGAHIDSAREAPSTL